LDNAYCLIEYSNGVRACLDICMFADATFSQEEVVAVGDCGKVEARLPQSTIRVGLRGVHWIGEVPEQYVPDDSGYAGHHFGSSLRENGEFLSLLQETDPSYASEVATSCVERGVLSVAMGVAAQKSISENRWVSMKEVLPHLY